VPYCKHYSRVCLFAPKAELFGVNDLDGWMDGWLVGWLVGWLNWLGLAVDWKE